MTVLLGNQACLDPAALARDCASLAIRTDWFGRPNSYRCPDGHVPGEAQILLSLSALRRLDPTGTLPDAYDLEFRADDSRTTSAKIPALVATSCDCITPGARDGEAAYLLTLVDRRLTDGRVLCDAAYGMHHRFTDGPLEGAADSTWQEAVRELWLLASLPGDYTIPVEAIPDQAKPEDMEFWQTPALQAIGDLSSHIGCRLCYDPIRSTYRIVRAGVADADFEGATSRANVRRIWDGYARIPARGVVPASVRILFAKLPHVRGLDGSPWYAVTKTDPDATARPWSTDAGVGQVALPDDLAATYDAYGALTNSDELATRATERARNYFAELAALSEPADLVYAGALDDAGLCPGSQVSSTAWSDTGSRLLPGKGIITTVTRRGMPLNPAFGVRTIDPLTEVVRLSGGGSGGLMDAVVQRWNPASRQWVDRQSIWVVDANQG